MNNQAGDHLYYSQQQMPSGQPQQMSAGQQPPTQTVTSGMSQYPQQHQPPMLHGGQAHYPNPSPYQYNGYSTGLTSPPAAPSSVPNPMAVPQNVLPLPGVAGQNAMQPHYAGFDTSGQQPPPGMKPRVTATLWEDEGSLCFQVEARGICVARREDNHMINGTKLLNVAGMTRGRRDGILKSEKVRHVVKIGPMHLKGVWIPYERALDFANKEKITEMLYPLFVHNIGSLLYHPTNTSRTSQVMAAAERRKQEQGQQIRNPTTPQGLPSSLPSIQQHHHHHHPMGLPGPQPQLPSHNVIGRPSLERAHTFPTPPTSGSSVMGSMGSSESFNWQGQGMNGAQGTHPMPIDSALSNTRSMPTTPATTPPGSSIQNMQPYPAGAQGYDASRQMYNAPPAQQSPYQTSANGAPDRMYGQPGPYSKHEMGPPSNRPATTGDQHDSKAPNGIMPPEQNGQHNAGEEEGDHEHEAEYTHDSGAYDAQRASYNYTTPGAGALANDTNLSPELAGSPNHHATSGRATPRTAAPPQPYYPQNPGYNTPPRVQQSTSNLYNVMSNDRAPTNGTAGGDMYAPPADMASSMPNGYATQPPVMNGSNGAMKRGRDDEDDLSRSNDLDKRRKTMMEMSVPAPTYDAMNRPPSTIGAPRRR